MHTQISVFIFFTFPQFPFWFYIRLPTFIPGTICQKWFLQPCSFQGTYPLVRTEIDWGVGWWWSRNLKPFEGNLQTPKGDVLGGHWSNTEMKEAMGNEAPGTSETKHKHWTLCSLVLLSRFFFGFWRSQACSWLLSPSLCWTNHTGGPPVTGVTYMAIPWTSHWWQKVWPSWVTARLSDIVFVRGRREGGS